MTKEIELWKGAFGNDYVGRNPVTEENIENRKALWNSILGTVVNIGYQPQSFLELGAGQGGIS